jgi:hypothetical protein
MVLCLFLKRLCGYNILAVGSGVCLKVARPRVSCCHCAFHLWSTTLRDHLFSEDLDGHSIGVAAPLALVVLFVSIPWLLWPYDRPLPCRISPFVLGSIESQQSNLVPLVLVFAALRLEEYMTPISPGPRHRPNSCLIVYIKAFVLILPQYLSS